MSTINIIKRKQTIHGPGNLRLELDADRIVPADPGQDTPAVLTDGKHSGTFWCAADSGELDGRPLNVAEGHWVNSIFDGVSEWLDHQTDVRKGHL